MTKRRISVIFLFILLVFLAFPRTGFSEDKDYMIPIGQMIKLAEEGDPIAQYRMGYRYQNGRGVKMDRNKAAELYESAALQGHVRAMNNLGLMFLEGDGIEKDFEKAWLWLSKAAEKGYAKAQFNSGLMCRDGTGIIPLR